MNQGADRYHAKRAAGISATRSDGSVATPENDRQSAGAEQFAAVQLGCKYNDAILTHGDGGHDFEFKLEVEVIWLGVTPDGRPRRQGHLIVNPYEPHRWADLYIVVAGSIEEGFWFIGWTTHRKLTSYPRKSFHGDREKFAMPTADLWPIEKLKRLKMGE